MCHCRSSVNPFNSIPFFTSMTHSHSPCRSHSPDLSKRTTKSHTLNTDCATSANPHGNPGPPYVRVQDLITDISELSAGDCCPLPEQLAEWGLVLDDILKIPICVSCGHALRPTYDAFYAHIKSKHSAISPELQSLLRTATETFSFESTEDVCAQPSGQAPIQGIKIQAGFYCPVMLPSGSPRQYIAGKVDTLYQHLCSDHRDNPK